MSRWKVTVGDLPAGARGVSMRYRRDGSTSWHELGEYDTTSFLLEVPNEDARVELEARIVDRRGVTAPTGRTTWIDEVREVVDRKAITDATIGFAAAPATQAGPAVAITPDVPSGAKRDDYEFEVRVSTTSEDHAAAVHVGIAEPGETVMADAFTGVSSMYVHSRPIRKSDRALGGWATTQVPITDPSSTDTQDHDSDFSLGTISNVMGAHAPLETVGGGGIRHKAWYAGDVTAYAGDASDVYAGDAGLYFGKATYIGPKVDLVTTSDFALQVHIDGGTITRPTLYAGDALWFAGGPPLQQSDGTFHDGRVFIESFQNGADETPIVADVEVAVSPVSPGSFSASDYIPHVPGTVHAGIRTYQTKITIYTWLDRRVTLDKFRLRRHCVDVLSCHRKPWSFIDTESSHGFAVLEVVMVNSSGTWVKAKADVAGTMPAFGIIVHVPTTSTFRIATHGRVEYTSHGLTVGSLYYVSPSTAGALTTTAPSGGQYIQPFLIPIDANTLMLLGQYFEVT